MSVFERQPRERPCPCRECHQPTWAYDAVCAGCLAEHEDRVGERWADEFEEYCRRNDER